jgi:hypothetical protein
MRRSTIRPNWNLARNIYSIFCQIAGQLRIQIRFATSALKKRSGLLRISGFVVPTDVCKHDVKHRHNADILSSWLSGGCRLQAYAAAGRLRC